MSERKLIRIVVSCIVGIIIVIGAVALRGGPLSRVSVEPEPIVISEGLAEKLMLQASDIGPGWSRSGVEVKAEGCWIDQNFLRQRQEGDLLFSEHATEVLWVYPDVESAIDNSELSGARDITQDAVLWIEEALERIAEGESYAHSFLENCQSQLEYYQLDLPFWDETYRYYNDAIMFRKDNIVVFLNTNRDIQLWKYDPLTQSSHTLPYTLTPEQGQWVDREQYADDFLFSLAEKAEGRISDYFAENS